MITVGLAAYQDENGNRIEYPGPGCDGVTITFRGSNNVARIDPAASATDLRIDFNSNNGTFVLGANPQRRPFSGGVRVGEDALVQIGDDVSSTSGVVISAVEGVSVVIGDDVMFASQNQVRADDGHPIFDVRTGRRVNEARSIRIGDHVWLAFGVIVLAGAEIGEGSVVGAGSIVTRSLPNNVIAVGSPATVARRHIAWERPHLGLVPPYYKPDASTVPTSPYWRCTEEDPVLGVRDRLDRAVARLRRAWRQDGRPARAVRHAPGSASVRTRRSPERGVQRG